MCGSLFPSLIWAISAGELLMCQVWVPLVAMSWFDWGGILQDLLSISPAREKTVRGMPSFLEDGAASLSNGAGFNTKPWEGWMQCHLTRLADVLGCAAAARQPNGEVSCHCLRYLEDHPAILLDPPRNIPICGQEIIPKQIEENNEPQKIFISTGGPIIGGKWLVGLFMGSIFHSSKFKG